jgi:glutathione peroxidase
MSKTRFTNTIVNADAQQRHALAGSPDTGMRRRECAHDALERTGHYLEGRPFSLQARSNGARLRPMTTVHDFDVTTIDGQTKKLSDFKGKTLLVVNVASRCGLTPHYTGLEQLYRQFAPRGFAVLGFPCNDFGAQEPGTETEIKEFCESRYDVTFPLFAKVHVKGEEQTPLYKYLTALPTAPDGAGEIRWNFAKFVVGPDGNVQARFAPTVEPLAPELVGAVEAALAK